MKQYLLIIGLLISHFAYAQSVDVMLLDDIEERVAYYQARLDLSDAASYRLLNILYNSAYRQATMDVFAVNPSQIYNKQIQERNLAITSAIGENKFKIFSLFEEMEKEELLKEHAQLFSLGLPLSELNEKLIAYRLKYILPRLSQENQNFIRSLSIERIVELKAIQSMYYVFCADADFSEKSFAEYLGPERKKQLMKLMSIFKQKTENAEGDLERWRSKWSKDQDKIASELMDNINVTEKQKKTLSKGQFAMKQELFLIHVMMIIPNNEEMYLKNLENIFKQQKKFDNLFK